MSNTVLNTAKLLLIKGFKTHFVYKCKKLMFSSVSLMTLWSKLNIEKRIRL